MKFEWTWIEYECGEVNIIDGLEVAAVTVTQKKGEIIK